MRREIIKIIEMIKTLRREEDLEPSFGLTLYEDIKDSSGKVLYSKGDKITPATGGDLNIQLWLLKELKHLLVKKEEEEKKAVREEEENQESGKKQEKNSGSKTELLQDLGGLPQDLSKFAGQKK